VAGLLSRPDRKTTTGPERRHLLSGIARCGICGGPLICSSVGGKRGPRITYRCRADLEGTHVMRSAETLEAFIAAVVIERLSRPDAARLLAVRKGDELVILRRERAALDDLMRASNDLRRHGLLTNEEFAEERAGHQRAALDLDGRIGTAEAADVLAPMLRDPAGAWAAAGLDQRRAIVDALMIVTVHPQPKGRTKGWRPGMPYFDSSPDVIAIEWKRG
jgi:hypothetical protein